MRKRLILASNSPRRGDLLREAGHVFDVVAPDVDEATPLGMSPDAVARELARRKAHAVADRVADGVILAADTVVAAGDEVIGKPDDRAHAVAILTRLANSRHAVITGVCLVDAATGRECVDCVTTWVTMKRMTQDEIGAYVDSGEALGKAGAYAIQHTADRYVQRVEGSFSNVVGLPMERVREMLAEFGRRPASGARSS